MGIIRNAANRKIRGRIGDTTYYVSNDRQIARQALNSSNYGETARRTISQQGNRVRWANLVQFYKLSKAWMSKAFENKKSGQSDYNRFMQLNLANARIYFTKEAVAASSCVVDEFTISQGSLRQVNVQQIGNTWSTDIQLGDLTIGAATTIAELTAAILASNNWAKAGMQISFISYQQQRDSLGYPTAICTAYELTLDSSDTRLVRAFLPEFCSQRTSVGTLGTNNNISIGGFAYIISQTVGGKTLVSTQKLVTFNTTIISEYSSERMRDLAIYSYGLNEASFLDSGSNEVTRSSQPLFVTEALVAGSDVPLVPGGDAPTLLELSEKVVTFKFSAPIPEGASLLRVQATSIYGYTFQYTSASIATDRMSVTATAVSSTTETEIESIDVVLSTGSYPIVFKVSVIIHE